MNHPVALFGVLVLLTNDHFLKRAWPGLVTGKLSDIAGMIFFPVLLHTLVGGFRVARKDERSVLALACVVTALAFTAAKTTALGNDAYSVTWGLLQWPLRAARAFALGNALPGVAPVVLVRDPSDLVAVPFVGVAYAVARASRRRDDRAPQIRAPRPRARGSGHREAPRGGAD